LMSARRRVSKLASERGVVLSIGGVLLRRRWRFEVELEGVWEKSSLTVKMGTATGQRVFFVDGLRWLVCGSTSHGGAVRLLSMVVVVVVVVVGRVGRVLIGGGRAVVQMDMRSDHIRWRRGRRSVERVGWSRKRR